MIDTGYAVHFVGDLDPARYALLHRHGLLPHQYRAPTRAGNEYLHSCLRTLSHASGSARLARYEGRGERLVDLIEPAAAGLFDCRSMPYTSVEDRLVREALRCGGYQPETGSYDLIEGLLAQPLSGRPRRRGLRQAKAI